MKKLNEIKDEVGYKNFGNHWEGLFNNEQFAIFDEVAKKYAKEVSTQALKDASERATIIPVDKDALGWDLQVDKKSILETPILIS